MKFLKNKKIIFSIIALVLFLVCVVGNFSKVDSFYICRTYFAGTMTEVLQLHNGDVFEQDLLMGDNEEGIQFGIGTYMTVLNGGKVTAELFSPEGELVATGTADLYGKLDNQVTQIHLGELDERVYNQKCKIRLTFEGIDSQLAAIYGVYTGQADYWCTINGEAQQFNLVMSGIRPTTYVEYRDIRLFFAFGIALFILYITMFKIVWKKETFIGWLEKGKAFVVRNKKSILLAGGILLGTSVIAYVLELIISSKQEYFNPDRAYAMFVVMFILAIVTAFKKYLWAYAHIFFFIVSMLVGSVHAVTLPTSAITWDEQIHYAKASYLSWGGIGRISNADHMIYSGYSRAHFYNIFEKASQDGMNEAVNLVDKQNAMVGYSEVFLPSMVAYIPTSLALYGARLLGIDFSTRYIIGKLAQLFVYSATISLAIKLLKGRGKIIAAAVALIPTNILLASCYGYDSWVTCFMILGYAIFIGELQKKEKVSLKTVIISVVVMAIGLLAKGVYFPLMFPFLLLKKERYESPKLSRLVVILGAVAVVISFLMPILAVTAGGGAAGGGDIRGGSDVHAGGQIAYILSNMFIYAQTLINFMWSFLNPDAAVEYMMQTAYQGTGQYTSICMILIGLAALIDNSENTVFRTKNTLAYFGGFIGVIGALAMSITALYISYTPVGAGYILGVQPRYILPVMFPFLFFAGEFGANIPESMKKHIYRWCLVGMEVITIWMIYTKYIVQY